MSRQTRPAGAPAVRRPSRSMLLPGVAIAALLASAGAGYGAEQVPVRGGLHATFARLVFDWNAPVGYQVAVEDRQLIITFDRAMTGRFDRARTQLSDYVGAARLEDGGKRVVIELKRPVATTHFVNEQSVVVDLRPTGDAPAKKAEQGAEAPRVPVVVTRRNSYTRLVFDWPVRTDYRFSQQDGRIALTFERPGEFVVPSAAIVEAPGISDWQSSRLDDGKPQVRLAVAGRVRHFRDGRKIVVDVLGDQRAAPVEPVAADAPSAAPASPANVDAPVPLVPESLRAADEPQAALPADAETLDVAVKVETDGLGLLFAFDAPTGAAVFRRGGWLWVVFDRPFRIDTAPIADAEGFVADVAQLAHGQATILRLKTSPGFNASVAREGNSWDIVIAPQLMRPQTPLDIETTPGADASVALGPTVATTALVLSDPEVGDRIIVVPVAESGHGMARSHQFSDFRVLASVQGVAVIPYADGLTLEPHGRNVVISSADGLRLVGAQARRRVASTADEKAAATRIFDFAAWRHSAAGGFAAAQTDLLSNIEAAAPDARNPARLELARFYFAHGMGARARGILELIAEESADIARLAPFLALRGGVNYMLDDFAAARDDLFHRDLDNEPEIALWRAALAARDGDFEEATLGLRQSDRFVQGYPTGLRKRFAFLGAETALENDDSLGGEFWLQIAEGADLSSADRAYVRVLRANIAALDGEFETAIKMYDAAIRGDDRRARARAALEKTELLLAEGQTTPEQAIEDLDRLRYVWRGDGVEFRVLRRLGELQIESGKFREGLQSLKRLVTNFPDHRQAPAIADHMRETFAGLYDAGTIDGLPPVMAIALFNDFRELAPAGAQGDAMIRRLADRLVSVDLLPQAAKLLSHQVEFRLQGAEKSRVGARLAVIHLLDRDPGEALAALADSHSDGIAGDLATERALISARAYGQLAAFDKALDALAGATGAAADQVRADIMWRKRDWASAAAILDRLAGAAPADGTTLDDVRSRYVLRRAVALALNNDVDALAALYGHFAPAMAATPYGADFQVIASVDAGAADFQDVLRRVTVADDFQAFMEGYRARLAQSQTAAQAASGDRTVN